MPDKIVIKETKKAASFKMFFLCPDDPDVKLRFFQRTESGSIARCKVSSCPKISYSMDFSLFLQVKKAINF
jgi:hypothetical protein